ncbi:proton-conducting transporter membrane subunit [Deltaproteobacteria bacterium TL4]
MSETEIFYLVLFLLPMVTGILIYVAMFLKIQIPYHYVLPGMMAIHLSLVLSCWVRPYPDMHWFRLDDVNLLFLTVLSFAFFAVALFSVDFLRQFERGPHTKIFVANLCFSLLCASVALTSNHIGLTWVFIEGTTLTLATSIAYYRNEHALEGAWKYIFICSVGIALAFVGILLLALAIAGKSELTGALFYTNLQHLAPELPSFWLKISFTFLFVGYSSKIGVIPFYTVDIDAKDVAPSQIGGLISSSLGLVGLMAVLRYYQVLVGDSRLFASRLFLLTGIASIILAAAYMLRVQNYKRMLAYSSMEHYGLILIGFGCGIPATALLHIVGHSLTKISLFFTAGLFFRKYQTKNIADIQGLCYREPILGWIWLAGFASSIGLPPFSIFFSEFQLFRHLVIQENWVLVALLSVFMTVIIKGMAKNIFSMSFGPPTEEPRLHLRFYGKLSLFLQGLCLVGVIVLGLHVLASGTFMSEFLPRAATLFQQP